jgi:hypothetical protein
MSRIFVVFYSGLLLIPRGLRATGQTGAITVDGQRSTVYPLEVQ